MKNFSKKTKIILSIAILISITLTFTQEVQAIQKIEDPIYFTPQVSIGDEVKVGEEIKVDERTFAKYIVAIYNWSIRAIVLLAIIMIMVAGSKWMWAGGNAAAITQAKNQITSALIGLVIAIGSYTLLNFINPSLVRLGSLEIKPVEERTGQPPIETSCQSATTQEQCEIFSGCEWENGECVRAPKCGLTEEEKTWRAQCCGFYVSGEGYTEYKYATIPINDSCRNVCGDAWITVDIQGCENVLGY